jgi:hypothetical protein
MEPAAARFSEFLRASSHCASRAWTSASTHSSKSSCSSLRRLATAFRRLRWKDSIEAPDDVRRYSKGPSMASSRDGESWPASSFVLSITEIDITYVITSYSTEVAVLNWQWGARLVARTTAEMRRAGRRCTDTLPARRERRKLEKFCGETECERTVAQDEAAFDVMNGAQATFSRTRLPAGPVPLKATSWQMPFVPRAGKSGAKRTRAWRNQGFGIARRPCVGTGRNACATEKRKAERAGRMPFAAQGKPALQGRGRDSRISGMRRCGTVWRGAALSEEILETGGGLARTTEMRASRDAR